MASSGDDITVGYWYYMSAHIMFGHKVDKYTRIRFGDRIAWTGEVVETGQIGINQPNLFGGEQRQGGVVGFFDLVMGGALEEVNAYLKSILPDADPMPAFRHRSAIVFKDVAVAANDPNLRPINVEAVRYPSPDWFPALGIIGDQDNVNPAHIIRECLTHPTWGLGYSPLDIDDASFAAAAQTLFDEQFGLSFFWDGPESLQDFVGEVIRHIEASLFVNPRTGQFSIKLIRGDYSVEDLPIFSESNIIAVDSFERLSPAELVNQVTVLWYDNVKDKKRPVTVHNTPVQELQGGIVPRSIEFAGISNADLAMKVATRELKKLSSSASRIVLRSNRAGATLLPGDVFILHWPDLDINQVVYRVGKVEFGAADIREVRIHAVEDVFGFGHSLYEPPPGSEWQDPIHDPAAAPLHRMTEVPYITVERSLAELETLIGSLDPMAGFISYQATKPTLDAFSYSLYTKVGSGSYAYRNKGRFTPTASIPSAVRREVTSTWDLTEFLLYSNVKLNTYAYLNDEIVEVTALSPTSVTVDRGVLDTVPQVHPEGSTLWFAEKNQVIDLTQWASGVTVYGKALPLTGKGELALADAPEDQITIARRWVRPYPPGRFQVNGEYWPEYQLVGDLVFTWVERNRLTQLSYYVRQDENTIAAEAGTTYTIRVYDELGVLKRTEAGLTVLTWTYTGAMESADAVGSVFKVTLSSVRDGLECYQPQTVVILREAVGWGYNWGNLWGGAPDL